MAERFQKIPGTQKISESYGVIDQNFEQLDNELSAIEQRIESLDTLSPADRTKLDGIEEGAQVNQNAFAKVNDLEASDPSDAFTITGGTGITVTTNPNTKEVNVTATGEATPGPHGSSHLEHGSDPIPYATETTGGLMTAADKKKLDDLTGLPQELEKLREEVPSGTVNVRSFGAIGDGMTDDTQAIIDADNAAFGTGRSLYFPPGTYGVSSTLVMKTSSIFGGGLGRTKILAISEMDLVIDVKNRARNDIRDICIDANGLADACIDTSYNMVGPSLNCHFERVFCRGYKEIGWIAQNNNDVYFNEVFIGSSPNLCVNSLS